MKRILKLTILGGCIIALLGIGFFEVTESRLPFFEYADTQIASDFSFDVANQIKIGDAAEEVKAILGQPIWKIGCGDCWEPIRKCSTIEGCEELHASKECHADCVVADQQWEYTDDGASPIWDFAWRQFAIKFREGKVTEIIDFWRYD